MRIVYVLTSLGMGGAERQVISIAKRMAGRGRQVAILVLRPRLAEEWQTAVPAVHLDIRKTPVSLVTGLNHARRFLADFKPDIVHSHGFHANIIARLLSLLTPLLALLSTFHNVYEGGWHRMVAYRLTDGLSQGSTAVSQAVASRFIDLKAVPQHKCVVVRNAFDIEELAPQDGRRTIARASMSAPELEDGQFLWLAAGRIAPAKDYRNLLRAFALVREARPDSWQSTRLLIAGEAGGALFERLRALASKLGIDDSIRWLGLRRDIPALLEGADAFVQASAWEGMPLAVGEAMAMEKPVVATDAGGVRELLGDTGILVPCGNPQALADAMLALMSQPKEARQALGLAARARIEREFNMDERIKEWERLYSSLGN